MVQQVFRLYMKAAPERVVEFLTGFDDVKNNRPVVCKRLLSQ